MLSADEAGSLFKAGDFNELRRRWIGSPTSANESSTRIWVAHASVITGESREAAGLVTNRWESLNPLLKSRALVVLGLTSQAEGAFTDATGQFAEALKYAHESRDVGQIAWAHAYLFTHLINCESHRVVTASLPEVRRAVTRAGAPHATAYLHQAIAMLEAQTGGLDEARRHCDLVDAVLAMAPNVWLTSNTLMNRACLDLLSCRYESAVKHLERARKLCADAGLARGLAAADANLAHALLHTGAFGKALRVFERAIDSPHAPVFVRFGALEGLARLHLASGELDACQLVLDRILTASNQDPKLRTVYHVRWSAITRARLLLKRHEASEAIRVLLATEELIRDMGDGPLEGAIHLTLAQSFAGTGQFQLAAERLARAHQQELTQLPEMQPQFYFAASLLTSRDLSNGLRDRATELWKGQATVSVEREMSCDAVNGEVIRSQPIGATTAIVDALASAMDLGHAPEQLARQLSGVLSNLGVPASVRVEAEPRALHPPLSTTLGKVGRGNVWLECEPPGDLTRAVIIGNVLKIGKAAATIERINAEERQRAALWPADPIETEAGALFLADEMQALLATIRRIAPTTIPVLITGETGTGKEVLARLIHAYSPRSRSTFLPFNCSAVPRDMLDSQLFGHRRGSFTGAAENFKGVIRGAANGTLFLDEIGEATLDVQPKLLRFLESSEVHPIGELHPARVDVRVIAATNADLDTLVSGGRFREDLFYRLNIVRLHIPPLRERRVEIPALAHHYLAKHAVDYGKGDLRLSEETMEYLVLYRWPGNVRQLANEMRRLAALAESGAVLMPEHLSHEIASSRRTIPASERTLEPIEVVVRLDQPMAAAVQHVERSLILYALKQTGANMEQTAAMLGLSRKGLYLKRQRYAIDLPGEPAGFAVA